MEEIIEDLAVEDYEAISKRLSRVRKLAKQRRLTFQIDTTPLRIRALNGSTAEPNPVYLTLVLDVAPRLIVGWEVHFRFPTCVDTSRALLNAILPTHREGMVGFGVPWQVHSDNGSTFGDPFVGVLKALRIFSTKSRVYTPTDNATCERVIQSVKDLMDFDFEQSLEDHLPQSLLLGCLDADGVYSEDEIRRAVTEAIVEYNLRVHSALGIWPARMWQKHWPLEVVRPFDETSILNAFCIEDTVKVINGNAVILPDGREHRSDALIPYSHSPLTLRTSLRPDHDFVEIRSGDRTVTSAVIPRPNPVWYPGGTSSQRPSARSDSAPLETVKPAVSPTEQGLVTATGTPPSSEPPTSEKKSKFGRVALSPPTPLAL
jgi:transposase InsO family protein